MNRSSIFAGLLIFGLALPLAAQQMLPLPNNQPAGGGQGMGKGAYDASYTVDYGASADTAYRQEAGLSAAGAPLAAPVTTPGAASLGDQARTQVSAGIKSGIPARTNPTLTPNGAASASTFAPKRASVVTGASNWNPSFHPVPVAAKVPEAGLSQGRTKNAEKEISSNTAAKGRGALKAGAAGLRNGSEDSIRVRRTARTSADSEPESTGLESLKYNSSAIESSISRSLGGGNLVGRQTLGQHDSYLYGDLNRHKGQRIRGWRRREIAGKSGAKGHGHSGKPDGQKTGGATDGAFAKDGGISAGGSESAGARKPW
jgi:hypothetical protein